MGRKLSSVQRSNHTIINTVVSFTVDTIALFLCFRRGDEFNLYSPATRVKLCGVQNADTGLVNDAVANCHATFDSGIWSRADVRERAKVLQRIADNLRKEIPRLAK
jgi:acyl-CoA reductase-like NAD-dependent aldehyde dehydrogenase